MTFGILVTLWASSSGLEALRHALNLAYDVADPPAFWRTRLESLLLTILAAIVVIVVMVLLVVIPLVLEADPGHVASRRSRAAADRLARRLARGRWASCCCSGLLMLLYRVLPNVRLRATEVVPGAVLAWAAVAGRGLGLHDLPAQRAQLQHHLWQPGRHHRHPVLLLHLGRAVHLRRRVQQRAAPAQRKPAASARARPWAFRAPGRRA